MKDQKKNGSEPKSYIAPGLMEMRLRLPTGSLEIPYVTVEFEGGQFTGYGVTPARYVTADPWLQRMIETSPPFLRGRIQIKKEE